VISPVKAAIKTVSQKRTGLSVPSSIESANFRLKPQKTRATSKRGNTILIHFSALFRITTTVTMLKAREPETAKKRSTDPDSCTRYKRLFALTYESSDTIKNSARPIPTRFNARSIISVYLF
jgi:hypothetical protein